MTGDEASVPVDHGGWLGDQHHASEPGPVDLSLQNEDLMAEGEDLGVTLVAGHQQQPETSNQ